MQSSMTYCTAVGRIAATLLAAVLVIETKAADTRRPNILLIVSDDQARSELGCFGDKDVRTPRLDRLAADGVRMTDFYVTWPACTPSRGSIMTGRYPQRNGLYEMIRNDLVNYGYKYDEAEYAVSPEMTLGLDLREIVLAKPLHDAGYACGCVGKWDSGRAKRFLPLQRGFDFFYGFANTGIDYWTHERYGVPSMFRGNERVKEEGYATDLFCREAMSFIETNKDRPWFLYLPFNAPHGASNLDDRAAQAPADEVAKYSSIKNEKKAKKYACITCMDTAIGKILDQLDALKLEKDTLVIFFSDNGGGGQGETAKLRGSKGTVFDGGLRVPFIARWPGRIPAGTSSRDFLTSLEVFPTVLAVAGVAPPQGITLDGFDMMPVLMGKKRSPRKEMFWENMYSKAARIGNHKWVKDGKKEYVFDLANDEGEEHDLKKEQPELAAKLTKRFAEWRREMDVSEARGPFRDY
jgi:arylsulfatase A-like enzyme